MKVLIAEDDLIIADMVEEALTAHGYAVCGIATTVDRAVALAFQEKPVLAIIDLRLADGGLGTDIAAHLTGQVSLGILYASGNASNVRLSAVDGQACISKPYTEAALLRALELVTEIIATGKATPPFPKGFKLLGPESALERTSNG